MHLLSLVSECLGLLLTLGSKFMLYKTVLKNPIFVENFWESAEKQLSLNPIIFSETITVFKQTICF